MATLFTNIANLVTVDSQGSGRKQGSEMQDIGVITDGALLIDASILWVGKQSDFGASEFAQVDADVVDCTNKTVLPGFVDSHTHIAFAGSRADEFARKLRGVSYQEIRNEGGGILRTMSAVRNATANDLADLATPRIHSAVAHGSTTIEIKSGYGLTTASEIAQLEAVQLLRERVRPHLVATFLGGHDFPPEYKDDKQGYIRLLCDEMLPLVKERNLAEYCDVFMDEGYYNAEQTSEVFERATELGFRIKLHADEFADVGAAEIAAKYNAVSADHLLMASQQGRTALKNAGTVATLLPGTAYFSNLPYADARAMISEGLTVALATDCNPGSSNTENMQTILSLACTQMRMTVEEAISAATINGAAALNRGATHGSLEVGKSADVIVIDSPSYAELVYHFGVNHVTDVWIGGQKAHTA